jgi:hypothetical protein
MTLVTKRFEKAQGHRAGLVEVGVHTEAERPVAHERRRIWV